MLSMRMQMHVVALVLVASSAQALKIQARTGADTKPDKIMDHKGIFDNVDIHSNMGHAVFLEQNSLVDILKSSSFHVFGAPELKPSEAESSEYTWMLFIAGMVSAVGGVSFIYWDRGLFAVMAINSYVLVLACMSNAIRTVFVNNAFAFPQFVTATHALSTCIVSGILLKYRQATTGREITIPTVSTWMTSIGPVALCFACSLGFSNLALLYTNTHFYEMLSASNVLMCAVVGTLLGRQLDNKLLAPLGLITVALPILAWGEIKFSLVGMAIVLTGNLLRCIKAQMQSILLSPGAASQTFEPLELTCWTSMLTFVVMVAGSIVSEGLAPWNSFLEFGVLVSVGITCVLAVILNTCGMYVMKEVGPVGQMIIGEIKGVLACIGGVAAFGELISMQQMIAYPILISGAAWYNNIDREIKNKAAQDAKNAVQKA